MTKNEELTPTMKRAMLDIAKTDRSTFENLIWRGKSDLVAVINWNTMGALERRGLIAEDHRVTHPEPWVVDNVFYTLTPLGRERLGEIQAEQGEIKGKISEKYETIKEL